MRGHGMVIVVVRRSGVRAGGGVGEVSVELLWVDAGGLEVQRLGKVILILLVREIRQIVGAVCDEGVIRLQGLFARGLVVQGLGKVILILQIGRASCRERV